MCKSPYIDHSYRQPDNIIKQSQSLIAGAEGHGEFVLFFGKKKLFGYSCPKIK